MNDHDLPTYYKLIDRHVVPCGIAGWVAMFQDIKSRRVGGDQIGSQWVSTLFRGLDHNSSSEGPPIVFETMILSEGDDSYCERCSTWDEAELQHQAAVSFAKARAARIEAMLGVVVAVHAEVGLLDAIIVERSGPRDE